MSKKNKPKHHAHHGHEDKQIDVTKRSVLNILRENMKGASRAAYIHRLIYIGDHKFHSHLSDDEEEDSIEEYFEDVITAVNSLYAEEKLSGFLLYYERYFCVIIDGTEQSLVRHLRRLLSKDAKDSKFGRLKLLVAYHHVNQRIIKEWTATSGRPPTLLEKLNPDADLTETMEKVKYVIEKLYSLGIVLNHTEKSKPKEVPVAVDDDYEDLKPTPSLGAKPFTSLYSVSSKKMTPGFQSEYTVIQPTVSKILMPFLPESSVLEFLLASQYTIELRNYTKVYGIVPYMDSYQDLVWPVECDFMPMNLQAVNIDPIIDLDPEVIPK